MQQVDGVIRYIRARLSASGDILFQAFIRHDRDFDGLLNQRELTAALRNFVLPSSDDTPEQLAAQLCPGDQRVRFSVVHGWLEEYKRTVGISVGAAVSYWWRDTFNQPTAVMCVGERERSIDDVSIDLETVPAYLAALNDVMFDLALNQTRDRARVLEANERRRKAVAERMLKRELLYTEVERTVLRGVFLRLVRNQEDEVCFIDTELPKVASVLGYAVTFEELAMTRIVHNVDAKGMMDFPNFLVWWALRGPSGKAIS